MSLEGKLTSLLSIVHSIPVFSSPLAQQIRSKDKTHTPNGHSSCASALQEQAHVSLMWTKSQEKNGCVESLI